MSDPSKVVSRARKNLHERGFDIARPVILEEAALEDSTGAVYKPVTDTIVVDSSIGVSEKTLAVEHELLHKWQFDLGRDCDELKHVLARIQQDYDSCRKFFAQADIRLPERISQVEDIKIFRWSLAYIELVEDHPEFDKPEEEIQRLESEAEELNQELQELFEQGHDPEGEKASPVRQRLFSIKEEIRELQNRPRKACKKFIREEIEKSDQEIEEALRPLKRRRKLHQDLSGLMASHGEGLSWFWDYYREGFLDDYSRDEIVSGITNTAKEEYSEDMLDFFLTLYGRYRSQKDHVSEEEAFRKVLESAREEFEQERKKLIE